MWRQDCGLAVPLAYDGFMPIVVQKYGGSSVADVSRMQQVAERVMRTKGQGHDVVVVVSAMGDTTDELLALDRKSTRLNSSHSDRSRMPSSA